MGTAAAAGTATTAAASCCSRCIDARLRAADSPDRAAATTGAALARRRSRAGAASSASTRSASPTPISTPRKRGSSTGSPRAGTATMDYMARHGVDPRAPGRRWCPGTLRVITARMNYLPPGARDAERRAAPTRRRRTSRATRSVATTTRCCARRLQRLADRIAAASRRRSAIASSPTARRCSRSRWRRRPGWAGAASTRCCSTREPGS